MIKHNFDVSIYKNFIFSIDENFAKNHTTEVVKHKNEIIVYLIPTNDLAEFKGIKKLFRFQKSCCTYEYGCIILDFTKHFELYITDLNTGLSQ